MIKADEARRLIETFHQKAKDDFTLNITKIEEAFELVVTERSKNGGFGCDPYEIINRLLEIYPTSENWHPNDVRLQIKKLADENGYRFDDTKYGFESFIKW